MHTKTTLWNMKPNYILEPENSFIDQKMEPLYKEF